MRGNLGGQQAMQHVGAAVEHSTPPPYPGHDMQPDSG
jgi:hypothetical protein